MSKEKLKPLYEELKGILKETPIDIASSASICSEDLLKGLRTIFRRGCYQLKVTST